MASNFKLSAAAETIGLDAYANAVGALLDGGTIEIRTGSPPTNTTDADSGTLLAEVILPDPAFAGSSAGSNPANSIASVLGLAAGDAGHYRAKNTLGVVVMQGTAGETADTPDLVLNEKTIAVNSPVAITSFSLTVS